MTQVNNRTKENRAKECAIDTLYRNSCPFNLVYTVQMYEVTPVLRLKISFKNAKTLGFRGSCCSCGRVAAGREVVARLDAQSGTCVVGTGTVVSGGFVVRSEVASGGLVEFRRAHAHGQRRGLRLSLHDELVRVIQVHVAARDRRTAPGARSILVTDAGLVDDHGLADDTGLGAGAVVVPYRLQALLRDQEASRSVVLLGCRRLVDDARRHGAAAVEVAVAEDQTQNQEQTQRETASTQTGTCQFFLHDYFPLITHLWRGSCQRMETLTPTRVSIII